jgi:crotonobetainyl-CoA:carnitine CoA-transferase CaiB-like acyl-CoA transferase
MESRVVFPARVDSTAKPMTGCGGIMDKIDPKESPLSDLTVLDLTVALAGPVATLLLAGLGARVIKIENLAGGDPSRDNAPYFGLGGVKLVRERDDDISVTAFNRLRNKLGVTLNLKHPRARDVFADLARKADLVVENFTPGTLDELGVGYEAARRVNPRIVYGSISGFGSDAGPGSPKALDTVIQALSGVMYVSGREDDPPVRVGLTIADLTAALFGVIGVMAAVHQARRTGIGQHVDVSMLGALTSLIAAEAYEAMEKCGEPVRTGPSVQRLAPFGIYGAKDGHLAICAYTDAFAHRLFEVMRRKDLATDERFRTRDARVRNYHELDALIGQWTSSEMTAEAIAQLNSAGIPASEVRDPKTAVHDPRVVARRETVPMIHPKYGAADGIYAMGLPIRFSQAAAGFDQPPPGLGEHNQRVYGEILGYDANRIAELHEQGVI